MSKPLSAKTALAQIIGVGVASTATVTDALAQENAASVRFTVYDLNLEFADLSADNKYSGGPFASNDISEGSGSAQAGDVRRLDLTIPVNEKWDTRFSIKEMEADGKVGGFNLQYGYTTALLHSQMVIDSQVLDFEAGYHLKLGEQDVRVFGGLRYVDLKSDATQSFGYSITKYGGSSFYIGGAKMTRSSELEALGLRAGAESSFALGKGFSVNGMVAVSAVTGDRENELRYSTTFGYAAQYPAQEDSDDTWLGSEAEVSLSWDVSPQTPGGAVVTVGYSWAQTQDILSVSVTDEKSD